MSHYTDATEFPSRVQAQAAQIAAILAEVSDGAGETMADRVVVEVARQSAITPPAILLGPPSWKYETYQGADAGPPGDLAWEVWIIAPPDDQTSARLWSQALQAAALIEADAELGATVSEVRSAVWQSGTPTRFPAYIVAIVAPLP